VSDLVVGTAFTATGDTVTKALKTQAKAADSFGARLKDAFQKASKESSIFKSVLSANLVSSAITKGFNVIQNQARETVSSYIDFDTAITMAAAKFPDKIKRGTKEFEELGFAAREVGRLTTFSASQAAEGYDALAGAGFDAKQSIAAMTPLVQFATATNVDLATATGITADAMGAFGLKVKDATLLTKNLTAVGDAFAFVTTTQKVSMEELSETVKMGGPAFVGAGQSMEHFMAMAGMLAGTGLKGSIAGTALKAAMLKLSSPTKAATDTLKKLGVQTRDDAGNMLKFGDIMAQISERTRDMGTGMRSEMLTKIFGMESISGVISLVELGGEKIRSYENELIGASGRAAEMTNEIKQTLGNRLKDLGSTLEELGFKFIEAFVTDGKDAIGTAIDAINNFDVKPIVEGAKSVLSAFKWLIKFLKDHTGTLKVIAAMWISWKVGMAAISFVKIIAGLRSVTTAALTAKAATSGVGVTGGVAGAGVAAAPQAAGGKIGAGAVMPVAMAAQAGYMVGNFIEETWLNPMREYGQKMEVELGNLVYRLSSKDFTKMSSEDLAANMQKVRATMANMPGPLNSLESGVQQVGNDIVRSSAKIAEFFGFLSEEQATQIVESNKGPVQKQQEQLEQLAQMYQEMALAIAKAKIQIETASKQASTEINVNVANAPAGTTVDAKSTGSPPKVNQSKAGKT
jgi:TP901 family phage tail tape measure protein